MKRCCPIRTALFVPDLPSRLGIIRRSAAGRLHRRHASPGVSPSRPHCVRRLQSRSCCDWTEVSLCLLLVIAVPEAVRYPQPVFSARFACKNVIARRCRGLPPSSGGGNRNVSDEWLMQLSINGGQKALYISSRRERQTRRTFSRFFQIFFEPPDFFADGLVCHAHLLRNLRYRISLNGKTCEQFQISRF